MVSAIMETINRAPGPATAGIAHTTPPASALRLRHGAGHFTVSLDLHSAEGDQMRVTVVPLGVSVQMVDGFTWGGVLEPVHGSWPETLRTWAMAPSLGQGRAHLHQVMPYLFHTEVRGTGLVPAGPGILRFGNWAERYPGAWPVAARVTADIGDLSLLWVHLCNPHRTRML